MYFYFFSILMFYLWIIKKKKEKSICEFNIDDLKLFCGEIIYGHYFYYSLLCDVWWYDVVWLLLLCSCTYILFPIIYAYIWLEKNTHTTHVQLRSVIDWMNRLHYFIFNERGIHTLFSLHIYPFLLYTRIQPLL